ncbi:hypothetical protein JYK00_00255 [Thermosipho ferrireducens]|uniref:Lipoprotein n=1 Tax=Thermosipho ferrireducens TaxID=2571116 RepID=A0ABX7S622_9BACT|nr:hypothetical protein [Thermosipho ferrireducens]QTA38019.1 hypothetical protein JYK00_00255 [Thermosipho ferrireducens]
MKKRIWKNVVIFMFILTGFFLIACENKSDYVLIGKEKLYLRAEDEIISINVSYLPVLSDMDTIYYFEGIAQTGGVNVEHALLKARVDAARKIIDFLGIDISTKSGEVIADYGSESDIGIELAAILNHTLEYIVWRRPRGTFYEIHTILVLMPKIKKFIPIAEDEFSRKLWKFSGEYNIDFEKILENSYNRDSD